MKQMLFESQPEGKLHVIIIDGKERREILYEDTETTPSRKLNIYKGVVSRIELPQAGCFVDIGEKQHGFLPFYELTSASKQLREGQELVVQVKEEAKADENILLTERILLLGQYLTLTPATLVDKPGKFPDKIDWQEQQLLDKLKIPANVQIRVRPPVLSGSLDALRWDLGYLTQLWAAIEGAANSAWGAFLIYQESAPVIRAIREHLKPDILEIIVSDRAVHEQVEQYLMHVMPEMAQRIRPIGSARRGRVTAAAAQPAIADTTLFSRLKRMFSR